MSATVDPDPKKTSQDGAAKLSIITIHCLRFTMRGIQNIGSGLKRLAQVAHGSSFLSDRG